MKITKRDGRIVDFDPTKIKIAIEKANNTVDVENRLTDLQINTIVQGIVYNCSKENDDITVEKVQDMVEHAIVQYKNYQVAKNYITYRYKHNISRDMDNHLMEVYRDLTFVDAKDNNVKRENANIDADSAMGTMLKYGSEGSKQFYTTMLIDPKYADAHRNGDIHIHDLDFYALTLTCCQIDLTKLFKDGFSTGHGFLREPNSITSYSALACIAIQSNQNDMHGGQSVPSFDHDMVPGVQKSYKKLYFDNFKKYLESQGYDDLTDHVKDLENRINDKNLPWPAMDINNGFHDIEKDFLAPFISESVYESAKKFARKYADIEIDKMTYQAMEALIHNLNTMHCLPGSERIWVFNTYTGLTELISMKDLTESFVCGKYFAYSMNMKTGECELKQILAAQRKDNNRELVTLTDNCGKRVTVTTNHKVLTVDRNTGDFYKDIPENITQILSPKTMTPIYSCYCPIEVHSNKKIYKNTRIKNEYLLMNRSLARLFGIYIADGNISGSAMLLNICDKYDEQYIVNLVENAFGQKITYTISYRDPDKTRIKAYHFNIGTYFADFITSSCGHGASEKHVPEFIFNGEYIYQIEFLNGYLFTDGRRNTSYVEASSISNNLIKDIEFMIHRIGELPYLSYRLNNNSGFITDNPSMNNIISLGNNASIRAGFEVNKQCNIEYPKYDLSFIRNITDVKTTRRKSGNIKYSELYEMIEQDNSLSKFQNVFVTDIVNREFSNSGEEYVYDISVADNENFMTEDMIYVSNSRAGAQVPFSSLNYGTDTTPEGRLVIKNLLLAEDAGMGNGETPIFPIQIFKVKEGINYNPEDPNYDLFKLAMKVSAKRLFPNFSFLDAPFNIPFYTPGKFETEVTYMGCRTRVMANVYDPDKQIANGRGNLSFTSINLPRLAIKANGDINKFYSMLDETMDLVIGQLTERFKIQCRKKVRNFPFLMGNGIWLDSDKLDIDDTVEEVIKHGTLSMGFIGLAECLTALIGKHHGESEEAQKLGLEIIGRIRKRCDDESKKTRLNYTCLATPAEGLSGRFVNIDKKLYGIIPGVTDKEYYTNSFHIPVRYNISAFDKIRLEAPYHALTNAGHISYVELDGDPLKNLDAFESIIRFMKESGIGYGSINHPVDRDPVCGYTGIIDEVCPRCGRHDGEGVSIEKLQKLGLYKHINTMSCGYCGDEHEEADRNEFPNTI